jgi:hypothetical protein
MPIMAKKKKIVMIKLKKFQQGGRINCDFANISNSFPGIGKALTSRMKNRFGTDIIRGSSSNPALGSSRSLKSAPPNTQASLPAYTLGKIYVSLRTFMSA